MEDISPKYIMGLIQNIEKAIWAEYKTYKEVLLYIDKWHRREDDSWGDFWENFSIKYKNKEKKEIDLLPTLHNIDGETILKIAIDIGVETPNYIPSIPIFRNEIKLSYSTASSIFEKAFKQVESESDIAIGLANSALESIIKEILKDPRVDIKPKENDTLYTLCGYILKFFQLYPNLSIPCEIKIIGSSLLGASKAIEDLRSQKTTFHGKVDNDYVIRDSLYAYFVVNSITTIGLFLKKYYEVKFPLNTSNLSSSHGDDLPDQSENPVGDKY